MVFSHINPDVQGLLPGRDDPCPCGSGRKTRRCCGVDRWRFIPRRGRIVGIEPADLAERIDELTGGDWALGFTAKRLLARALGGLAPGALSDEERSELSELYGEHAAPALELLQRAGYGRPRERKPRAQREHGARRAAKLDALTGKLPRALAKRLPSSADTHRSGPNHGEDVYGEVSCSQTLRAMHLGLLAAAGGLWHSRNPQGHPYASATAGELAQLLTGRLRIGGKDIAEVHRALSELEALELCASVNPGPEGTPAREDLRIPGPPLQRVERLLPDGSWVKQARYAQALGELSDEEALAGAQAELEPAGGETIRIHLAPWVREAIAHGRPTLVNFRVWAHLRPLSQRLYAWLQASHRDAHDEAIQFYLGAPLRYTLGLRGRRQRAAACVRAALRQLYGADLRYARSEKWSVRSRWANTGIPAFRIAPARIPSRPSARALARGKCAAERPSKLRALTLREAREQVELVREALAQRPHAAEHRRSSPAALSPAAASRAGP